MSVTSTKPAPQSQRLNLRDVSELVIGSCVLAVPMAVTEEVWTLSVSISTWRVLVISLGSQLFIAFFAYRRYRDATTLELYVRVVSAYLVTILVAAVMLLVIDRLPLTTEPLVAIKRTLLVAFPAAFSATVVDSMSQ